MDQSWGLRSPIWLVDTQCVRMGESKWLQRGDPVTLNVATHCGPLFTTRCCIRTPVQPVRHWLGYIRTPRHACTLPSRHCRRNWNPKTGQDCPALRWRHSARGTDARQWVAPMRWGLRRALIGCLSYRCEWATIQGQVFSRVSNFKPSICAVCPKVFSMIWIENAWTRWLCQTRACRYDRADTIKTRMTICLGSHFSASAILYTKV